MYIKEIVVDGFKSYAHRTVIAGFDPHFNAITGLNGSGKSNILDSICFVLGITNLSQVRAGNLSELVYKQGQAGVSKATVTLIFDNSDTASSPVGYESFDEVTVTRQVLIGGKSKYLINGRNAPANQVQNLFHSVQLNVNNPHFLIMQGRITKVLNMKPNEILGMIEEAAGTRMYETKKIAALKTIDKKDLKLDELNKILNEDINPTLERLRGEKNQYLKWSKNNTDIERKERLVVAYEFVKAETAVNGFGDQMDSIKDLSKTHQENASKYREALEENKREIVAVKSQYSGEFESEHQHAKELEDLASKEFIKFTSKWKNRKDVLSKAAKDLEEAQNGLNECEDALKDKQEQIMQDAALIHTTKQQSIDAEAGYNKLQEDYQNMCAGISSSGVVGYNNDNEQMMTLPDQISKAHNDATTAEAKVQQAEMKIKHLSKNIKSIKNDMKKEEASSKKLSDAKIKARDKVNEIQSKLQQLSFSEEEFKKIDHRKNELEKELSNNQDVVESLTTQLECRLAFNYEDPVRGFDRSKVKGLVARLIQVPNPKYSTALEVVAGGGLYQVVVDETITGKALLNKGKLKRRVTILPLDKITPRRVPSDRVEIASKIASEFKTTSHPAIELVGFDEEVRNAIEFIFGSALVVDGMDAANSVCDKTRTKTVTLDGDVYDPSGTISGGSNDNLGTTLKSLSNLVEAKEKLQKISVELKSITKSWEKLVSLEEKFSSLSGKLELASTELAATEKHISQTSFGMLEENFNSLTTEIELAKKEKSEMEEEQVKKWELYHKLKSEEDQLTLEREQALKQLEESVKVAKKALDAARKNTQKVESASQTLELESQSLQAEIDSAKSNVEEVKKALTNAQKAEEECRKQLTEKKNEYEKAKEALNEIETQLVKCNTILQELNCKKADLSSKIEVEELEVKKLSVKITKFEKDQHSAEKAVSSILRQHPWIESEKVLFGVENGDYDFAKLNAAGLSSQLKSLKAEQANLAKKINKKVMGMIEKAEGEYTELVRKRKVVENDKKKIKSVIDELDVKKKTELQRTWVKVNRDFGSIFSTLLPGTSAKLEPPEGMESWEGLEVKVTFGDVWKESLSELSGGQRSLLALSLILSLLLFKPAPMYILDEVDAALDLSHTQNIGNMLKTHFSQSQFIVVSLKEGMFNNANVIFRTKFVDGVSTVTRTLGTGSSKRKRIRNGAGDDENSIDHVNAGKSLSGEHNIGEVVGMN